MLIANNIVNVAGEEPAQRSDMYHKITVLQVVFVYIHAFGTGAARMSALDCSKHVKSVAI